MASKIYQRDLPISWISPTQKKTLDHRLLTACHWYLQECIEPCAQLQVIMAQSHSHAGQVLMIDNPHGHTEQPGLSQMPHQDAPTNSKMSGTVSLYSEFANDDEILLAADQIHHGLYLQKKDTSQLCIMFADAPTSTHTYRRWRNSTCWMGCTDDCWQRWNTLRPASDCLGWSTQPSPLCCTICVKISGTDPHSDLQVIEKLHSRAAEFAADVLQRDAKWRMEGPNWRHNTQICTFHWSLPTTCRRAQHLRNDTVLPQHVRETPICNYNRCSGTAAEAGNWTNIFCSRPMEGTAIGCKWKATVTPVAYNRRSVAQKKCWKELQVLGVTINTGYCPLKVRERHSRTALTIFQAINGRTNCFRSGAKADVRDI